MIGSLTETYCATFGHIDFFFFFLYINPLLENFRLVQIETKCRQHFKVHLKWKTRGPYWPCIALLPDT